MTLASQRSGAVLVVDHQAGLRRLVRHSLEAEGRTVHECETLADARRLLAGQSVDVVVLDRQLRDGDGLELLPELSATVRVVVHSDLTDERLPTDVPRVGRGRLSDLLHAVLGTAPSAAATPAELTLVKLLRADPAGLAADWVELCRQDPLLPDDSQPPGAETIVVAVGEALARPQPLEGGADHALDGVIQEFAQTLGSMDIAVEQLVCLREVFTRRMERYSPHVELPETQARLHRLIDRAIGLAVGRTAARLQEQAFVDSLTGLWNRRALDRDFAREANNAARHNRVLSLVVIDVDGLKEVNDTQGHSAGDRLLQSLAENLKSVLRAGDVAYRMGGDEFVLLLPETEAAGTEAVVERLQALGAPSFKWGAATFPGDCDDPGVLVEVADQRLFERRGKATGRAADRPARAVPAVQTGNGRMWQQRKVPSARWGERPMAAAIVGALIVAGPLVGAVLVATLVSRLLPDPDGVGETISWWVAVLGASAVALTVVDRAARRLLPLAALLRLSLTFPDRAPSRFGVALRAGSVPALRKRLEETRAITVDDDAGRAATTILMLAAALSSYDPGTRGHSERVRAYTDLLAAAMKLPPPARDRLRWASLLHDVGKLTIPRETLNKDGSLEAEEWALLHRHPDEGARVAAPLRSWLGEWGSALEQHHERWDGRGYPRQLAGEAISLGARIVAVADAFEVMTGPRSYKRPITTRAAREELARCAGRQFDPTVVRAFLNISLGRLRWILGPIAFLTSIPLVGISPRVSRTGGMAAGATVAIGLALVSNVVATPQASDGQPTRVAGTVVEREPDTTTAADADRESEDGDDELAAGPTTAPVSPDATAGIAPTGTEAAGLAPRAPATTTPSTASSPTPPPNALPPTTLPLPPALIIEAPTAVAAPTVPVTSPTSTAPAPRLPAGNQAPTVSDDRVVVTRPGGVDINVLANDADRDGTLDEESLEVLRKPVYGRVRRHDGGGLRYILDPGSQATRDSFTYRICDDDGACSVATVFIEILQPLVPANR